MNYKIRRLGGLCKIAGNFKFSRNNVENRRVSCRDTSQYAKYDEYPAVGSLPQWQFPKIWT